MSIASLAPAEGTLPPPPLSISVVSHVPARFQKDPAWSETGDRYLLKLFRDHLFHQVTEAGTPWIDLSHIVSCLNKVSSTVFPLELQTPALENQRNQFL